MIEILKRNQQAWDVFTKKEEYHARMLDRFGRFPYYLSEHRSIFEPQASTYLMERGLTFRFPENKTFAVCLSHDVDSIYPLNRRVVFDIAKALKRKQIKKALQSSFQKLNTKWNPWWNFRDTVVLEGEYGAVSSFFFLASDVNYAIADVENELGFILDHGCEVALHSAHHTPSDVDKIKGEKEKLERVIGREISGCRIHTLKFKVPETWEALSKAGFEYDTSLGYADCVGFRNGMCHPFKPFNLTTRERIDIVEVPLNIMDSTLFDYMRLDLESAWKITKRLIDVVERHSGVLTILWHNTYLVETYLKLYERILSYCRDKNAWMTSGAEIVSWAGKTWKL
jgi:peptidoglycan/xylan/chitin deacetylase (PgdA/CDA1 family)